MKTQAFTIPGRLPCMNEIVAKARYNRFAYGGLKKKWTKYAAECALAVRPIKQPVTVIFRWFEPNMRRDIDGISAGAKFILDGLVESGKLPTDGRKWVVSLIHSFPMPDKLNPRIEVELQEA